MWDHDKARDGDKFFMVKVGPGVNGVVMSGEFTSDPYQGEDWSGKGRQVFYSYNESFSKIADFRVKIPESQS